MKKRRFGQSPSTAISKEVVSDGAFRKLHEMLKLTHIYVFFIGCVDKKLFVFEDL